MESHCKVSALLWVWSSTFIWSFSWPSYGAIDKWRARLLFLTVIDDAVSNWAALILNLPKSKGPYGWTLVGDQIYQSELIWRYCSEDGKLHETSSLVSIFYELSLMSVQYIYFFITSTLKSNWMMVTIQNICLTGVNECLFTHIRQHYAKGAITKIFYVYVHIFFEYHVSMIVSLLLDRYH